MYYRANTLDVVRTTFNYMGMGLRGPFASLHMARLARASRPAAVISDYEPVAAWTASALHIPLVTLDHQQVATECEIESASPKALGGVLLRRSNRMTYRNPTLRIITSFFQVPLRERSVKGDRVVIGPVLRPEVPRRTPTNESHIVVYQTSRTFEWLDRVLDALPGEKRVYGAGRKQSGHPERAFSENSFLDDLASCRFVVVNGGHTTISEALYYGKPVLCFPVRGQAEQELNAHYVAKLGFGMDYRPRPASVPDFSEFLDQEAVIRRTIAGTVERSGNAQLEEILFDRLTRWSGDHG